jgi:N-acetylglucosaminyl-diphospho-decaprenol L-rhamnosyltransferase
MTTAIVVSYDSAAWIRRCLRSLEGVTTIVVDNASHDDSARIVGEEFPHVRLVVRSRNGGFAVAVNEAAGLAPDEDLLLVNPDAQLRAASLGVLEAYLDAHPRVGIVVPRLINPDGSIQHNARTFPTPWTMLARRSPFGRMPVGRRILSDHLLAERLPAVSRPIQSAIGAVMLVRRAAIREVGLLDERIFLYGEDWDWCYRMWAARWEVHIEPAAVIEHEYERKSRRTLDMRSAAVRHHWASAIKLIAIHPGLVLGRMPRAAWEAARWEPPPEVGS